MLQNCASDFIKSPENAILKHYRYTENAGRELSILLTKEYFIYFFSFLSISYRRLQKIQGNSIVAIINISVSRKILSNTILKHRNMFNYITKNGK